MKKKKVDPQERTENRRTQVLAAAECCFLKHGFHGASMAEISKKAQMSVGHIYNYFESKEAIICALVEQEITAVMELFKKAIENRESFIEVVRDYVEREVKFNYTKREYAAMMHDIMAEMGRNPNITETMWNYDVAMRKLLADLCRIHKPDWSEEKTEARVELLMGLMHSYKFRAAINPDINKEVFFAELTQLLHVLFDGDGGQVK